MKVFALLLSLVGLVLSSRISAKKAADVNYHLWLEPNMAGDNGDNFHSQVVSTTHGKTFFNVMQQADDTDSRYKFEYKEFPFGKYITSIGGRAEVPSKNIYWMIYKLPGKPNVNKPPSDDLLTPVGVDAILVAHDEHYLFWRKKVEIDSFNIQGF